MITKRSGIENHSCVDFLKGEVSKLKQENLQFTYLMKIKGIKGIKGIII